MLHVIYDDQCGFCIRSLKVCRALDVSRRLRFHGASTVAGGSATFPELAHADLQNAMFAVAPDRSVTRGFFAVRRIAREVPLLWPLLVLLHFPGSGLLGPRIYAWVARNRHRFGCESEVCDVGDPGRPPL
jgi:predicted DCC family thiol-disulfide oxidoreductase YuxK